MVEALILEAAKIGLQLFFTNLKLAGKTDEEIQRAYEEEKAKFFENKPEDLPDIE